MSTLQETASVLKVLSICYGKQIEPDRGRIYHAVLGKYPRVVLGGAAIKIMEQSKYFPQVHELNEAAALVQRGYLDALDKFDEETLWYMFLKNIPDPGELTEDDIERIRKAVLA